MKYIYIKKQKQAGRSAFLFPQRTALKLKNENVSVHLCLLQDHRSYTKISRESCGYGWDYQKRLDGVKDSREHVRGFAAF